MKKDLIIVAVIVFALVLLFSGVKIQSPEEYYLSHLDDIKEDSETVFLSISCETVLDNWDKLDNSLKAEGIIPQNGIILDKKEYVLRPNDTVYEILNRVLRYNKIQAEFKSNIDNGQYIEGINNLYQFSCGELSGWMYKVNGEFLSTDCAKVTLKDGDIIEIVYTCDLGRDVGAK